MNKTLFVSMVNLALCLAGSEAKAEIYLSHCTDELHSSVTNANTSSAISAAVAYSPEFYAPYQRFSVEAVEFGLYDISKLSSLKFWIRKHLSDASNLVEVELEVANLTKGWNRLKLDTPIDLAQWGDTLYMGYDYTQSVKSAKVIAGSGKKCACGCYVGINGKWKDYSTSYEPLAIRGILVGTHPYDIGLTRIEVSPRTQRLAPGEKPQHLTIRGEMANYGSLPVMDFDVHWKSAEKQGNVTFSCNAPSCTFTDFEFEIEPPYLNTPNCAVEVEVALRNGSDADPNNNSQTFYYEVLEENQMGYPRSGMLLEQYASLNNGFVPKAQNQFDQVVVPAATQQLGLQESALIPIVQHYGYGPADRLTVVENNPYNARAIFGPEELQYAPAVSVNHREVWSTSTNEPDTLADRIVQAFRAHPYQFCQLTGEVQTLSSQLMVSLRIEAKTWAWCIDPVLIVCLVRNETPVADQKDYFDQDHPSERNTVVQYLTPQQGISLLSAEDKRLSADIYAAIASGAMPTRLHEEPIQVNVSTNLPVGFDLKDYHIVAYVCEMTGDSQLVDAVVKR